MRWIRLTTWIGVSLLAALAWPSPVYAASPNAVPASLLWFAGLGLVLASGLLLVLICRDKRRAERLSASILIQAGLAVLAGILLAGHGQGSWTFATRLLAYATCTSAVAGALVHVSALRSQSRLLQKKSLGQCRRDLKQIDSRLEELLQGQSDRFKTVYAREAASIDRLRTPDLGALWQPAKTDPERRDRLHSQFRYLSYGEQVVFKEITRLLLKRERRLVAIFPFLKREYLLERWCDAHVCLYSATAAFALVHLLTLLYY